MCCRAMAEAYGFAFVMAIQTPHTPFFSLRTFRAAIVAGPWVVWRMGGLVEKESIAIEEESVLGWKMVGEGCDNPDQQETCSVEHSKFSA